MKYQVRVASLVTETYEIEASTPEEAVHIMWDGDDDLGGANPTNTSWDDAEVLDVTLTEEKSEV
tara:strand:- start:130 stop:321 length:192 start_codon:yes stop_codon:yes gene_type:complete